jgi:hypothetical protein
MGGETLGVSSEVVMPEPILATLQASLSPICLEPLPVPAVHVFVSGERFSACVPGCIWICRHSVQT